MMTIRAASSHPKPALEPDRWTPTALPEQAEKTPWFNPEGLEVTLARAFLAGSSHRKLFL